jgi:hypothetical protein
MLQVILSCGEMSSGEDKKSFFRKPWQREPGEIPILNPIDLGKCFLSSREN